MRCFFCEGPAHPATGHFYTPTIIACYRCYKTFLAWYKSRLRNPLTIAAAKKP